MSQRAMLWLQTFPSVSRSGETILGLGFEVVYGRMEVSLGSGMHDTFMEDVVQHVSW